jgi:hypothetical protein
MVAGSGRQWHRARLGGRNEALKATAEGENSDNEKHSLPKTSHKNPPDPGPRFGQPTLTQYWMAARSWRP